jgi:PhnB protein
MPPQISPMLAVSDGNAAIEFYQAAFGATVLWRLESGGHVSPESLGGSTARMIMIVNDPDAAFQQAVAAGATVVWPVEDQPYGWRVGRIVDPFGHHWEIGKPLSV